MKKKLLITTQDLNMGGVETSLINLLNSIDYQKWEVDLVTLNDGIFLKKINKNVNYMNLKQNTSGFLYRIFKNILVSTLYNKYMKDKEYDVAIAYYGLNNYSDMYAAASKAKNKYIWVHNDFKSSLETSKYPLIIKIRNIFMKRKFKYFDKIINVSNNCKKNFDIIFSKFKEKSIVLYNILDEDLILKLANEKTNIKIKEGFNICVLGRLVKSKQVDKALIIIKSLKEKGYNVNLYIIGDGPEKITLEKYVKENNLQDKVTFTGIQKNPYNILKQCDLLLSLSKYESFGLVILEALFLNIPIISYANDGAKDIYENICPKNKMILIENENNIEIVEKIINKEIKFSSKKFDINKYNKYIKLEVKKIIGVDLK